MAEDNKINIKQENGVLTKDAELFSDGCFMTHYQTLPAFSFGEVKLTTNVLQVFLENGNWEMISRKSLFDNDTNKYIYRKLNNDGEIKLDDETLNHISNVFLLKNDDVGIVRIDMEGMGDEMIEFTSDDIPRIKKADPKDLKDEDEEDHAIVDISFFDTEKAREVISFLLNNHFGYKEEETKAQTNIITQNPDGMYKLKEFQIPYQDIDFDKHYNDGLREFHEENLMASIENKKDQSFFILHGPAGTGKTSYIRYMIAQLGKKHTVIYLPPTMISALSDPSFINFMANNSGSVLVIEDAEEVVQKAVDGRNSAVNNLLNLTDGILGNCFNLDIICTFNAEIDDIDEALKRKGRLDGLWKFLPLEKEKVETLCEEIGIDIPEKEKEWTLGNLMNHDKERYEYKTGRGQMGFK